MVIAIVVGITAGLVFIGAEDVVAQEETSEPFDFEFVVYDADGTELDTSQYTVSPQDTGNGYILSSDGNTHTLDSNLDNAGEYDTVTMDVEVEGELYGTLTITSTQAYNTNQKHPNRDSSTIHMTYNEFLDESVVLGGAIVVPYENLDGEDTNDELRFENRVEPVGMELERNVGLDTNIPQTIQFADGYVTPTTDTSNSDDTVRLIFSADGYEDSSYPNTDITSGLNSSSIPSFTSTTDSTNGDDSDSTDDSTNTDDSDDGTDDTTNEDDSDSTNGDDSTSGDDSDDGTDDSTNEDDSDSDEILIGDGGDETSNDGVDDDLLLLGGILAVAGGLGLLYLLGGAEATRRRV